MDTRMLFDKLSEFLNSRISSSEAQMKTTSDDPVINVHLVGQSLAYRETLCFLLHLMNDEESKKEVIIL